MIEMSHTADLEMCQSGTHQRRTDQLQHLIRELGVCDYGDNDDNHFYSTNNSSAIYFSLLMLAI